MAIAGGIIVIIAFAAIIKKYETRMVLLAAGFLMCFIGGVMGNAVATFSKTMVHGSLVPVICTVMGFSFVMKITTCDRHLVESISGVITRSKLILIPLATLLTWWINIAIPSAAGCSAAVGSILIPTLMAAGVHPAMAAAAVLAGTWGSAISPGQAHNIFVADLAQTDLMTVIMAQVPAAIVASIVAVVALTIIATIRKEGPDEALRLAYHEQLEKEEGGKDFRVNPIYALIPLVPLILLVLGSKQLAVLPLTDVPTAMIVGTVLALIVTRQNPQEITKKFFDGMGEAYGGVIGLIVSAAVFTEGMAAMGLTNALIEAMKGSESIAKIAGGSLYHRRYLRLGRRGGARLQRCDHTAGGIVRHVHHRPRLTCPDGGFDRTLHVTRCRRGARLRGTREGQSDGALEAQRPAHAARHRHLYDRPFPRKVGSYD